MKKILTNLSLAAASILLLGSCAKINERIDDLEGRINGLEKESIASISTQIESINSSIADLGTIRTNIQNLTSTTAAQAQDIADLNNEDTEIGKKISDLKKADESINARIDDLQKYVNDTLKAYATTEWVKATFSTLAQYEATCDTIAKIDERIGAMDTRLSKSIEECADSLKSWVNVQLDGYYTIAQMDAKVAQMNAQIDTLSSTSAATADNLKAEIAATKAEIDTVKANIRTEYKSAIETAINELDGKLSAALEAEIVKVNSSIFTLYNRILSLESSVSLLSGKVTALEAMIQSVALVPAFSDGSVEYEADTLYLDFSITPATVVPTLDTANINILLTKVLTKAVAIDTLPLDSIKVFTKDVNDGTISIKANIAKIIDALNENSESLAVAVNVNKGISNYTSNYLPLHIPVDSVVLAKDLIEIKVGKDTTLTATVYPANASNKDVIWTSKDNSIATVDQNGKITAVAPGTVKIAVTTVNKEKTDTCVVTVKPLTTTGTAKATIGGMDIDVNWVQLWAGGPKFAKYNVGVTDGKAESYGGYYCWGKAIDKDSSGSYNDGESALSGDDDTATNLWGSNWRMPTQAELQALLSSCDVEWMDGSTKKYNNTTVTGLLCKGKGAYASNSVFLPAAGLYNNGAYNQGDYGLYWSSTPDGSNNAYYLLFNSGDQNVYSSYRYYGYSVRAVLAE